MQNNLVNFMVLAAIILLIATCSPKRSENEELARQYAQCETNSDCMIIKTSKCLFPINKKNEERATGLFEKLDWEKCTSNETIAETYCRRDLCRIKPPGASQ